MIPSTTLFVILLVVLAMALLALAAVYARAKRLKVAQQSGQAEAIEMHHRVDALTARNRHLETVLDAAREIAIIAMDSGGAITLFNHGAERMLGYDQADVLGRNPGVFHLESEFQHRSRDLTELLGRPVSDVETLFALVRDGGSEIRPWTYKAKDGHTLQVSISMTAVHDLSGAVKGFLAMAHDITEQIAAEDSLLALNRELELRVSERTRDLHLASDHLWRTLEDLTLTKDKLIRSEKLAGLGAVVRAVAHEINTPVGVCLTVASTIENNTIAMAHELESGKLRRKVIDDYTAQTIAGLKLLIDNLHRTADLVVRFKGLAVSQSNAQRKQFSLDDILKASVTIKRRTLGETPIAIDLALSGEMAMDSYPEAIDQMFSNLIDNAIVHGFADRGHGTIKIEASIEREHVRIIFKDNGCGMVDEVRAHVFDPFFTTRLGHGQSGLGMSVCYNLVTNLLGGSIDVASTPGKGCVYVIVLPVSAPFEQG